MTANSLTFDYEYIFQKIRDTKEEIKKILSDKIDSEEGAKE